MYNAKKSHGMYSDILLMAVIKPVQLVSQEYNCDDTSAEPNVGHGFVTVIPATLHHAFSTSAT